MKNLGSAPAKISVEKKVDGKHPQQIIPGEVTAKDSNGTHWQQTEDLFKDSSLLRQVAENIEQVIWLRDNASGQILYVNPTFESVWGRTCESLYANPKILIESVHPEDRVQVMVARDRSNHKPFDQVYRIFRPDGSLHWISTHSFLVRTGVEKYPIQVYIAQDETRHNQVDQALRKALDRSREQFTLSRRMSLARKPEAVLKALMSAHELRTAHSGSPGFLREP